MQVVTITVFSYVSQNLHDLVVILVCNPIKHKFRYPIIMAKILNDSLITSIDSIQNHAHFSDAILNGANFTISNHTALKFSDSEG